MSYLKRSIRLYASIDDEYSANTSMNVAYFCRSVACEANTAIKAESEIKLKETSIDSIELNELSTIEIAGNFVKINDYLYMHLISSH